jgi:hypothetical protein
VRKVVISLGALLPQANSVRIVIAFRILAPG